MTTKPSETIRARAAEVAAKSQFIRADPCLMVGYIEAIVEHLDYQAVVTTVSRLEAAVATEVGLPPFSSRELAEKLAASWMKIAEDRLINPEWRAARRECARELLAAFTARESAVRSELAAEVRGRLSPGELLREFRALATRLHTRAAGCDLSGMVETQEAATLEYCAKELEELLKRAGG